jgi:hypothetical protein
MVAASYTHSGVPYCWARDARVEGVNGFMEWMVSDPIHSFNAIFVIYQFIIDMNKQKSTILRDALS